MTDYKQRAIAIEQQIRENAYYVDLWEHAKRGRTIVSMSDVEINAVCNSFWLALPDSMSIHREPFNEICDMCSEFDFNVAALRHELSNGIKNVEFEKLNGEVRVMNATCDPVEIQRILGSDAIKIDASFDENATSLVVLDVDLKEWRRIRPESVIDIN